MGSNRQCFRGHPHNGQAHNQKIATSANHPNGEWRYEWRQVEAPTLREAMAKAEQMPDVARCVEASVIPGGVVT